MTPAEALHAPRLGDADDTRRLTEAHHRTLATRAHYYADRVRRSAAIELCDARGHPATVRGCSQCVADIRATDLPLVDITALGEVGPVLVPTTPDQPPIIPSRDDTPEPR